MSSTWADSARELEALGYSTLFAPDHFDEGYGPITAMATAAAATTTLGVATAVLAVDFRHPAVLARELASIDQLSEGRLEVGLGAGYEINDYAGSGMVMDPPKVRVDRLIEYVRPPGPVRRGTVRLRRGALSGDGARRLPTGRAVHPSSSPAAGARLPVVELHAWLRYAQVTSDARAVAEPLTATFAAGLGEVLASPIVLVGTVEEIVERLHERRERWGYSYFTIQQPVAREFAAVVAALAV